MINSKTIDSGALNVMIYFLKKSGPQLKILRILSFYNADFKNNNEKLI